MNKHLIQETAPEREGGEWDQERVDRMLQFYLSFTHQRRIGGTSLVVQWLRFHASSARGTASTPGRRAKSHMPQLAKLRIGNMSGFFLLSTLFICQKSHCKESDMTEQLPFKIEYVISNGI